MYENARTASGNWIKDFGYEIVNEDWNIQYPDANEELRRRIQQQLEAARSRLDGDLMAMRRAEVAGRYGSDTPQFRVDSRGNVVSTGGTIRSGDDFERMLTAQRNLAGAPVEERAGGRKSPGESPSNPSETDGLTSAALAHPTPTEGSPSMQSMQNTPQRSQNWALKGATQSSSGISRTVRIRCEADSFVLSAQAGLVREQAFPINDSISTAADQLVQAIWEFQNSWGVAGENRHWRPILQVRVVPGGEQRLRELKVLLKNSGWAIEE
jgi:hypothetical protein